MDDAKDYCLAQEESASFIREKNMFWLIVAVALDVFSDGQIHWFVCQSKLVVQKKKKKGGFCE